VTTNRDESVSALSTGGISVAQGLLSRVELLEMLDRAVAKRVTLISAPAGSGKTSLLRTWAGRSTNDHRVSFVSVEPDQHDAQRFWCTVLDAIRSPAGTHDRGAPPSTPAPNDDQIVNRVLLELAEQCEPLALVIDDLHELRSRDAFAGLERLLADLPGAARVVLSTRRNPPIKLHRLRLAGEVTEIRADSLRFTERETLELLTASGIGLSSAGAAALHQRTEGWAAGLRLAVISLSGHPHPDRFVAEFSGGDRPVGEYLIAEMLERQPSEVQSMMLRTSLVDRMNGELADLLAGRSGSERILLELEDANAFVVSLDPERTWFRYHQLLADCLRLELRRTLADELPDLHRRAAKWFADRGEVVEAVRHMLAAGDWPDAAALLAEHSFRLVLQGQVGTISALLQSFPEGASADHPELALARAATQLTHGRLEEARAQLALAESHVQSAPPARRRRLAVAIASGRLTLARRSGQFAEVIEQVNFLASPVAGEPDGQITLDSDLRGFSLMNLGIVELWSGRPADAERHLSEGAALARTIGRPYLEVGCRAYLGFAWRRRSFTIARERCHEAIALAERHGWGDRPVIAPALATLAGTAIYTGALDEGERWLDRAWKAAESDLEPATEVLLRVATGMLHAARGEQHRALEQLEAADATQSLLAGEHALASQVSGWRAATHARLGMLDQARALLAGLPPDRAQLAEIRNARAVICLAEGDPDAALDTVRELLDGGEPTIFAPALVEAHLLAGLAHLELGDRHAAAVAVEGALAAAEPDRVILTFATTASVALLDAVPRHQTAHAALLDDIADLLRGTSLTSADRERLVECEELSPSELRVLRYLPTNLTRAEIARELHVSVNTVNTHVRNIYSKLDARDRSSAVHNARELRLVSSGLSRTSSR
jgi:LuxR family transcriptional regulator, maltose regulon positive regulatory protein